MFHKIESLPYHVWIRKAPQQLNFSKRFFFIAGLEAVEVDLLHHVDLAIFMRLHFIDDPMGSLTKLPKNLKV